MLKNFLLTAGLFLSVSAVNAATLIRYEFNGDLTDSSGNSADATVVAGSVSYVAGVDGQAASFDGRTAVAMPNDSIRGNPDFTLSFRFKTTSTDMVILGYQNTQYPNLPGNYIPIVGVTPAGELRVTLWEGSSAFAVTSSAAVNDDAWHRVDVVADTTNGTLEAFLDGTSIGSANSTVNHLDMQFNHLGYTRPDGYFSDGFYTGALDLLTLSDDAQPPTSPAASAATPVPALPLSALWILGGLAGLLGVRQLRKAA